MKKHFTPNKTIAVASLIFCACGFHASAQGNLVVNGGFETLISGKPFGWAITNSSLVLGNPGWAVSLDNTTPSLNAIPMATQTISGLVSGNSYTVSGQYQQGKNRLGNSSTNLSFGVAVNGIFLYQTAALNNTSTWYNFNFSYTATSSSALLSLSSQLNGTGYSYAIDNIFVVSNVPEPTTLALFGLGGGLLVTICKRGAVLLLTRARQGS